MTAARPLVSPAVGRAENIAKRASLLSHPEQRLERTGSALGEAAMLESQRMATKAKQFRAQLLDGDEPRTEEQHQMRLFEWKRENEHRWPGELELLIHIPNGGHRKRAVAGKLKALGVKRGVHDLLLPVKRPGFSGLWIELKALSGTASSEQIEWRDHMRAQGYRAEIVKGWQAARDLIVRYLES